MQESQEVICKICDKNKSKYKCPKCYINYCSVECYQSLGHNQCSENFYKRCFMDGMKENDVDDESKSKFQGMLNRLKEQLNDDDDMSREVMEEFNDFSFVDELDDQSKKMWGRLSTEEKKAFCVIKDGCDFTSLIKPWKPWWMESSAPLIEDESEIKELMQNTPLISSVAKLDELVNGKTLSNKLCFTVVNIIYGYAYVMRFYNGDYEDLLIDVAQGLLSISACLGEGVCSDVLQAVSQCTMSLDEGQVARDFFMSPEFSVATIQDVVNILKGPNRFKPTLYIESCLSDCLKLFSKAIKVMQREKNKKDNKSHLFAEQQQLFFKAKKKLEFLISWSKKFGNSVSALSGSLEEELHNQMTSLSLMKSDEDIIRNVLSENRTALVSQPKISIL